MTTDDPWVSRQIRLRASEWDKIAQTLSPGPESPAKRARTAAWLILFDSLKEKEAPEVGGEALLRAAYNNPELADEVVYKCMTALGQRIDSVGYQVDDLRLAIKELAAMVVSG